MDVSYSFIREWLVAQTAHFCEGTGYNHFMDAEEIRYHLRGRWKEVEEIERRELRASTVKQNWMKLNAIMLRARRLNLLRHSDTGEMEVFLRWAKLKDKYETSQGTSRIF